MQANTKLGDKLKKTVPKLYLNMAKRLEEPEAQQKPLARGREHERKKS